MRDDFSQRTKDLLANRVGWKCSNPNCRKATRGAGIGKENIINIGVASHITAASKGGPRYDENITSQERASAENGIWLCQSCSKLIDSDVNRYTIAKLKKWKEISEQMAVLDFLLKVGDKVNVERSMVMNGRLDGHIVQGHVDETAKCIAMKDADGSTYFTFEYELNKEMARKGYFTVDKGSVTVNGVSLTVCDPTDNTFTVAIIPYTRENTNFCDIEVGTVVNIEFDILGKYIARLKSFE